METEIELPEIQTESKWTNVQRQSLLKKIYERIRINENGCHIWTGHLMRNGYGQIRYENKLYLVHRLVKFLSEEFDINNINILILHKNGICKSKACINNEHTYVGDKVDNSNDFYSLGKGNKIKQYCPKGHSYNEDNTGKTNRGGRYCKLCMKIRNESRNRKKAVNGS